MFGKSIGVRAWLQLEECLAQFTKESASVILRFLPSLRETSKSNCSQALRSLASAHGTITSGKNGAHHRREQRTWQSNGGRTRGSRREHRTRVARRSEVERRGETNSWQRRSRGSIRGRCRG